MRETSSRLLILTFLLFTFCFHRGTSQIDQGTPSDTARATEPDTIARVLVTPIPFIGSIDPLLSSHQVTTDSTINFTDYRYVTDALRWIPDVFIRDFGRPGQQPDVTIQTLDHRYITFLNDGIQLDDLLLSRYNQYLFPTEYIDRIELVEGTRAFLYSLNGTAGSVNSVSRSKKAIKPYSHIRYSESAFGFSVVDGTISQDIIRGLNVTAGAQHFTYGPRFINDNYDAWNGRVKARYNISNEINLFASEMYNQTQLGLFGGIDLEATPNSLRFDRIQATVRNSDAYEKTTRHDARAGIATRLLPDSNAISTLTLYLSSNLREYRDEENRPDPNGIFIQQDQRSQWMGAKFTHHQALSEHTLDVGAELQYQRTLVSPATQERRATLLSISGKTELQALPYLRFTPYARLESYLNQTTLGYGADATISLSRCAELFGGYSRSFRFPTFLERNGIAAILSSNIDDAPERHHLFEAGARWLYGDVLSVEARAFHRTIWNPIAIDVQSDLSRSEPYAFTRHQKLVVHGVGDTAASRLGSFFGEGTTQFVERIDPDDVALVFPRWTGTGGFYFWDSLFGSHLVLKAGIRERFFSSYLGREFNEQALVYLPNGQSYQIPSTAVTDLVIIAKIGDAYVHIVWDNLLSKQYVMTSFYPMPERQLRFGIGWEFLD